MTWVIASPRHWGYAIAIADTQVTFDDNSILNGLQKLYGIAPGLAAGFAGNVKLGFTLLGDLLRYVMTLNATGRSRQYGMPLGYDWWPQALMRWRSSNLSTKNAALLLVGVHPTQDLENGKPMPFVLKLATDAPRPIIVQTSHFYSIGAEGTYDHCGLLSRGLHGLDGFPTELPFFHPDPTDGPEEYIRGMVQHIAQVLTLRPITGVSVALHACYVLRDQNPVSLRFHCEPGGEIGWDHDGGLADSWESFRSLVRIPEPLALRARA